VARGLVPLTGEAVERLPAPCRSCLFWERGAPAPLADGKGHTEATDLKRKQAWVSAQVQQGRPPGRLVLVEGRPAGFATFAPARELVAPGALAPRPSGDALQLATVWVAPDLRGHGLGRLLLQSAIREAIRLDLGAVEVYGDRRWRERGCVLPVTWLLREGFEVHREAPRLPLLRLEVRRTARWAESLEAALEGLRLHLPRPAPARVPERVSRTAHPGSPTDGH
jgi:GNAT superfamily N-acetyltransferase